MWYSGCSLLYLFPPVYRAMFGFAYSVLNDDSQGNSALFTLPSLVLACVLFGVR